MKFLSSAFPLGGLSLVSGLFKHKKKTPQPMDEAVPGADTASPSRPDELLRRGGAAASVGSY